MTYPSVTTTFTGPGNRGLQVGYNSGTVEAHFHPVERPETPPSPSLFVPFRRDPDFVDRGTILHQLHQKCAAPGSWTALVGLGGVGKSQLAIEHCYRIREQSAETWVFWVHASNAARFEQSYRDIADRLKISGRGNPRANIFKLVHDWLCDEKKGRWILVLDNVDDASFLLMAQSTSKEDQGNDGDSRNLRPLLAYLPQSQNGSILVTTRTRAAALKLMEESDIIAVLPMEELHALALLEKKLGIQGTSDGTSELAAALEFMPLAIVQAAAYITQRVPRCSVRQYLLEFQKSDHEKTSLLHNEAGQLRRDREAKNSIIITWQISFDYIYRTKPSAANLLSFMSFFDRQGIPEALVRNRVRVGEYSQHPHIEGSRAIGHLRRLFDRNRNIRRDQEGHDRHSKHEDGFEDDLLTLRDYSFVSVAEDQITFEMHALVQLAMRKWLGANGQLQRWKQQYIKTLYLEFPTGEHENWGKCQALFPHVKSALKQQPEGKSSLCEWASLLYNAAWYAWRKGNMTDAETMAIESMQVRGKVLGQKHQETLSSMAMVGLAYNLKGRWKEAEELEVQVMETRKRVIGEEHPDTLTSITNLASTYRDQGRWKEAEELEVRVMETSSRMLGEEHPDTLTSIDNLASTYRKQGRWKEAEELEVQVMETSSRVLGEEHPSTLTSMANLASTFWNEGRWKEAKELFMQVAETSSRVLGEEHPDTLTSIANLASTYRKQGRWKEAEELEARVMETSSRVLGEEHPDTLTSMANLASTFWNQGRWKEAEELFMQVMETRKRVLGEEHPDTLASMNNLAFTLKSQSRNEEATSLMKICLQLGKQIFGTHHPNIKSSLKALNEWQIENI